MGAFSWMCKNGVNDGFNYARVVFWGVGDLSARRLRYTGVVVLLLSAVIYHFAPPTQFSPIHLIRLWIQFKPPQVFEFISISIYHSSHP